MRTRIKAHSDDGHIVGFLEIPDQVFSQLGWQIGDDVLVLIRGREVVLQRHPGPVAQEKDK